MYQNKHYKIFLKELDPLTPKSLKTQYLKVLHQSTGTLRMEKYSNNN
jgi:hypothetical protein